MPRANAVVI